MRSLIGRPTFKCEFLRVGRKEEKRQRGKSGKKGGWGGPHHVIFEDKLMQTLLGQFWIKMKIEKKRKETEKGETLRILSFVSVLSKISRSALSQRKCFINEASLYISST